MATVIDLCGDENASPEVVSSEPAVTVPSKPAEDTSALDAIMAEAKKHGFRCREGGRTAGECHW